ncbi:MAG: hypothetical protein QXH27_00305 [Candidatus Micrarchaeia archaeon]
MQQITKREAARIRFAARVFAGGTNKDTEDFERILKKLYVGEGLEKRKTKPTEIDPDIVAGNKLALKIREHPLYDEIRKLPIGNTADRVTTSLVFYYGIEGEDVPRAKDFVNALLEKNPAINESPAKIYAGLKSPSDDIAAGAAEKLFLTRSPSAPRILLAMLASSARSGRATLLEKVKGLLAEAALQSEENFRKISIGLARLIPKGEEVRKAAEEVLYALFWHDIPAFLTSLKESRLAKTIIAGGTVTALVGLAHAGSEGVEAARALLAKNFWGALANVVSMALNLVPAAFGALFANKYLASYTELANDVQTLIGEAWRKAEAFLSAKVA